MTPPCECVLVESSAQLTDAARLFRAYADALPFELDFQGFEAELAALPGRYAPPTGAILLAMRDGNAIGCVGLRALEPGTCEMKRMYVDTAGRGMGVGRALGEAVIALARQLG
ncbi:MAG: GNAT family N-acetyltransferase, partial [Planctomycetota bacterium]